ncbi:DUF7563 family protein [Halalkalicoccus jeotgali]|nr:hypothetical protein [Halalkalicoccus jeotgali]
MAQCEGGGHVTALFVRVFGVSGAIAGCFECSDRQTVRSGFDE